MRPNGMAVCLVPPTAVFVVNRNVLFNCFILVSRISGIKYDRLLGRRWSVGRDGGHLRIALMFRFCIFAKTKPS
jgi:hypothetical protein